jgi:hypothetical protein
MEDEHGQLAEWGHRAIYLTSPERNNLRAEGLEGGDGVTNITRYGNIVSNAEAQQDIEFDPIEPDDDNPYIEGTEDADLGEEAWHNMST